MAAKSYRSLVIDTETSGLFDFSKPADAEGQPRLAHLAMIYLDPDFRVERRFDVLIKPDGWVLDASAALVNGLTMERLNKEGVGIKMALLEYAASIKEGRVVIAFNSQFDLKVLRGELRRAGMDDLFSSTKNICVMRAMTEVCQLPYANGREGFKFPKLAEALERIGIKNAAPHTGMGDADAALEIALWLDNEGLLPAPGVYLAKKKPHDERSAKPKAKDKPAAADDEIPA